MKHLLSVIIILTVSLNSHAKKIHYPMEIVAGMADLIVVGKIENVGSGTYQFRISNTVKGQSLDLIKVQMFKEWTCDRRIKKAKEGQELFLFLTKKAGKFEIINGSTGEIFIDNGLVKRAFKASQRTTEEWFVAIKTFTISYQFKGKDYEPLEENIFIQLRTDKEAKEVIGKSELTKWLFERVKEYKIEN
ncbi:MAG: hypothetical protein ACI9J3_001390 [Parvicellaceae bacterium]|jgi:hypothetical protein